jgi:hypothetical protein
MTFRRQKYLESYGRLNDYQYTTEEKFIVKDSAIYLECLNIDYEAGLHAYYRFFVKLFFPDT